MGRSRSYLHALVLTLVTILAWPWGVTLSVVEGARLHASEPYPVLSKRHGPKERVSRSSRWFVMPTQALSEADEGAEEGDETITPGPDFGLISWSTSTGLPVTFSSSDSGFRRPPVAPFLSLCRLRC